MTRPEKPPIDSESAYRAPAMNHAIVNFGNPPVSEVVFGIGFKSLPGFSSPQMGLLWSKFHDEFPVAEVKPRLVPPGSEFSVAVSDVPPAPRYFLRSTDQSELVQVQEDRFLYNWIKSDGTSTYPRYAKVVTRFQKLRKVFEAFLDEQRIEPVSVQELRLTYVNHVPKGEGWEDLADVENVFPNFRFKKRGLRYLTRPTKWSFTTHFPVRDPNSYLEYMVQTGTRPIASDEQQELLVMHLTVIGSVTDPSEKEIQAWFDMAREAIDMSFLDLTNPRMQKEIWRIVEHE